MNETKPAGALVVLPPGERSVTRKSGSGGVMIEYPDVHLTEKPAGGIWRVSEVTDEVIVRFSPLTLLLVTDEEARKQAAEAAGRSS